MKARPRGRGAMAGSDRKQSKRAEWYKMEETDRNKLKKDKAGVKSGRYVEGVHLPDLARRCGRGERSFFVQ